MGLMWLVFLIGPLYLIGMWFNEDQRANIIKIHAQKRLDCVFKYYKLRTLHSIVNAIERDLCI